MENLQRYLAESGTLQAALAVKLGISRSYMSQLVGGTKRPSLDLAFQIAEVTAGAVPLSAWVLPEHLVSTRPAATPTEDAA